jgi:enamine deaminase RidA (YjgF/YER057c/UK114 family)
MSDQSSDERRDSRDRDFQQQVLECLDQLTTAVGSLRTDVGNLSGWVDKLSNDGERFNDRFSDYQQATQWVV